MKVGVLGSGDVGRTIGSGLSAKGHDVILGSRSPSSEVMTKWKSEGKGHRSTGTFAEAARHGELLVISVLGSAALEVVRLADHKNFTDKILIDTTNQLDFSKGMPPGLLFGVSDSLGEQIQKAVPAAHLVKAFNTVPSSLMFDPKVPGGVPEMLICGNDAAAKSRVTAILKEFGWPGVIDIGPIEGARWLEALVPLWVRAASAVGSFNVAFKLVRG